MSKVWMLYGLPASGKSTWAKEQLAENPTRMKMVSKDRLRELLDNGKWSKQNEKFVLQVRDAIVKEALTSGFDIIVDDTNLASIHKNRLQQLCDSLKCKLEVVDFTHVSVEECIQRDSKRPNYVGEKVIRDMYNQYLYKPPTPYPVNPKLPDCGLVDIDGTVALMDDRSPYDWSKVGSDKPRWTVIDAVKGWQQQTGAKIIFFSGRDGSCYEETRYWLKEVAGFPDVFPLYMRTTGDMRKDSIVKKILWEAYVKDQFNVRAIFDDRRSVVALWRELGYGDVLFDVGNGLEF